MKNESNNGMPSAANPEKLNVDHDEFFPKGAIAFFIALIAFFAMVWLALYGIMIYRQGSL